MNNGDDERTAFRGAEEMQSHTSRSWLHLALNETLRKGLWMENITKAPAYCLWAFIYIK